MAKSMGADGWAFIKNMAAEQGVTLKEAGVNIRQTLGYAIDLVFVAHERKYPNGETADTSVVMPIVHSSSGDVYAARVDGDGHIIEAAGPLNDSDSRHSDFLIALIANNPDREVDGRWLEGAKVGG